MLSLKKEREKEFIDMEALSGEIGFNTLTWILGARERQWPAKGKENARNAIAEVGGRLPKAQRREPAISRYSI